MKYFNLLDEPWIPVKTRYGGMIKVGLKEVLLNAKNYIELAESIPPNLIALYRILLAIVHRSLTLDHGKWSDRDRTKWLLSGFPEKSIINYLEKFRERFWFFHPEYPFMQVKALANAEETKNKIKPWTQLALEKPSGESPVMFDHSIDDLPKLLSIGDGLKYMLGYLQFVPGGLVKILRTSDKAGPLANSAAIIPLGSNLSETLCLALHPWNEREDDYPSWELPNPKIKDLMSDSTLVSGPNDRYTRLTRGILWLPENESDRVNKLLFCEGLAIEENELIPDPMVCYRKNKDGKTIRLSFQEGRAFWRDLPLLLPSDTGKYSISPAVTKYASNVYKKMNEDDRIVPVLVAGVTSDQAKILRWRIEKMCVPQKLLLEEDAYLNLCGLVQRAEDVFKQFSGICSYMIAQSMRDPDHKETKEKARAIQKNGPGLAMYFSKIERSFVGLMNNIANGKIDKAFKEWSEVIESAVTQSWEVTCRQLGSSHLAIKAEAQSYFKVHQLLIRIRNTTGE